MSILVMEYHPFNHYFGKIRQKLGRGRNGGLWELGKRIKCVRYGDSHSEWTYVHTGVPQGTKLGPIIFLAIINDAVINKKNTNIRHFKYVDDMTVIETRDVSVRSNLPAAITELHTWSSDNKMRLKGSVT